ncbi:MAG: radical SAM protein [Candidatus Altiarchaeota archaeon]|nr:radical SAM protein [Candidatus Altiarchaeota archaeon]
MENLCQKLTPLEMEKRQELKKKKPAVYEKVMKFEKKLSRGESIAIIQLQYDYICNFKCEHCSISDFQHKRDARKLTISDVRDLSRQADEMGLAHIDVTGGEPLAFSDLDQLIDAIDPSKFYIQCDTNGWLMTDEKARHLKEIGVDKIQLSLDSLSEEEHDSFRRKPGAYKRAIEAIDSIKKAGLNMHIATVVTHQRLMSEEFAGFLEFAKSKGVAVSVCWPKPVGEWAGNFDVLITQDDIKYLDSLRSKYHVYEHLTPGYGLNIGCIAVKRMISITQYGDVLPCPWMYFSLGNIFDQPLKDIVAKGMKYFGQRESTCLVSASRDFLNRFIKKTYGRDLPVPIEEIMPVDWRNSKV